MRGVRVPLEHLFFHLSPGPPGGDRSHPSVPARPSWPPSFAASRSRGWDRGRGRRARGGWGTRGRLGQLSSAQLCELCLVPRVPGCHRVAGFISAESSALCRPGTPRGSGAATQGQAHGGGHAQLEPRASRLRRLSCKTPAMGIRGPLPAGAAAAKEERLASLPEDWAGAGRGPSPRGRPGRLALVSEGTRSHHPRPHLHALPGLLLQAPCGVLHNCFYLFLQRLPLAYVLFTCWDRPPAKS